MLLKTQKINWHIGLVILLLCSMVAPYVSMKYHGFTGLIPLLFLSLFLVFTSSKGHSFASTIRYEIRNNGAMVFFLILFIIGVAFSFLHGADDYQYFLGILVLPICFIMGLYCANNSVYKQFAIKSILFFIFLNILFTGQSIGPVENARDLYIESGKDLSSGSSGFWALIGLFCPLFVNMILKEKKMYRKMLFLVMFFYVTYKLVFSGFATPLALFFINVLTIVLLYLFFNNKNFIRLLKTLLISILFLVVINYFFEFILKSNFEALMDVQWRFNNILENPTRGGHDDVSRFSLMEFSIKTFTENVFFGGGGNIRTSIYEGIAGGHSSLFDLLAVLGLFGGGGAFLLFMLKGFKNAYSSMKVNLNFESFSNLSVVISMFIGGIMNPYWSGSILICFLMVVNISKVKYYE